MKHWRHCKLFVVKELASIENGASPGWRAFYRVDDCSIPVILDLSFLKTSPPTTFASVDDGIGLLDTAIGLLLSSTISK
jgi:hypothetical protein